MPPVGSTISTSVADSPPSIAATSLSSYVVSGASPETGTRTSTSAAPSPMFAIEVFSAMPSRENGYGIATGGSIIHELGGARMGSDPGTSVVDATCRAHDCRNLFIADGAPFVSQADKNPTWTILALAWRTSDHIMALRQRREL